MASLQLFIGTYTHGTSKGIYALRLDRLTGELSAPYVVAETTNPTYLALSPDHSTLYAVSESDAMALAFRLDAKRERLTPLQTARASNGAAPCHLSVDHTGKTLLLVNYHTAIVASLPIAPDGSLGSPKTVIHHRGSSVNPDRQSAAHAHSVNISADNRFALVCDLGLDKIFTYRLDPTAATLSPAEPAFTKTTPGSGPRHLAFSPDGSRAFVVSEMGATVTSYHYGSEKGTLTPIDKQSTLPANFKADNKCAAIRVHPNGRFVYASNRGHDSIAVFQIDPDSGRMSLLQIVPVGGRSPRDFALSPEGDWLVAANQDSNSLTVFRVSDETGRLSASRSTAVISMPVCVLFAGEQ